MSSLLACGAAVTDHADTIRRCIPYPADDHHGRCASLDGHSDCDCYAARSSAAHAALDALLAERQQAQEERDAWKASAGAAADRIQELAGERQQAQDKLWEQSEAAANLITEVERLEAERQQAQEERDQIRIDYENVVSDRTLADAQIEALERERQQAIDALRYIKMNDRSWIPFVDEALVKLGEKP